MHLGLNRYKNFKIRSNISEGVVAVNSLMVNFVSDFLCCSGFVGVESLVVFISTFLDFSFLACHCLRRPSRSPSPSGRT